MPIYRQPDMPHMFCPKTAREIGLIAAVVEMASRDLSTKCVQPGNQIVSVRFTLCDIEKVCNYLTREEIEEAAKTLLKSGIWGSEV